MKNNGMLSLRYPKIALHNVKVLVKIRYQRMIRGWSDYDAYNFHSWFLGTIPEMIKHMRNNLHGTPIGVELEEWETILETIENSFRNADIDYIELDGMTNDEVNEFIQTNLSKGMNMLNRWFFDLWD